MTNDARVEDDAENPFLTEYEAAFLERAADIEDECRSVSVGGLACDLGLIGRSLDEVLAVIDNEVA